MSLPADASAKKKSGKQNQWKKKEQHGRRSTSPLSALEVQMETPAKEGKIEDLKGLGSFSHKELQRQLSKSQKKPARKRSESGAAKRKMAKKPKSKRISISTEMEMKHNNQPQTKKIIR